MKMTVFLVFLVGGACSPGAIELSEPLDTAGADTGVDTNFEDSGDRDGSGYGADSGDRGDMKPTTTLFETDFGDGGTCSYSPFVRSDGIAMNATSSYSSEGECGVFVFGGGSASGPSLALEYSSPGYTPGTEYAVTMTVENVIDSSLTVYADFGGGTTVSHTVAAGGTGVVTIAWEADFESATLRLWTGHTDNYGVVVHDLVISY